MKLVSLIFCRSHLTPQILNLLLQLWVIDGAGLAPLHTHIYTDAIFGGWGRKGYARKIALDRLLPLLLSLSGQGAFRETRSPFAVLIFLLWFSVYKRTHCSNPTDFEECLGACAHVLSLLRWIRGISVLTRCTCVWVKEVEFAHVPLRLSWY